jgi:hypothetical protein
MTSTHPLRCLKPGRIGALLALVGLLFAATIASVTHSVAMPMMAGHVQAMDAGEHGTDHGMAHGGAMAQAGDHDCAGAMVAEEKPETPSAPCEQGCLLCKSCSLVSVLLTAPQPLVTLSRYHDYQSVAFLPLTSVIPAPPSEPPRA